MTDVSEAGITEIYLGAVIMIVWYLQFLGRV